MRMRLEEASSSVSSPAVVIAEVGRVERVEEEPERPPYWQMSRLAIAQM